MKIIDGHIHINSSRFIPVEFVQGVAHNMLVESLATYNKTKVDSLAKAIHSQMKDHFGDQLVADMDSAKVTKSVLLVPDFSYVFTSVEPIDVLAKAHYEICRKHDNRFIVFLGIDPRHGTKALDAFKCGIFEYGFKGLKLYPPCGYSASDPSLYPFYELCEANKLPVLLHTGPTSPQLTFKYSHPFDVDEAARLFPGVNFILAHGGVVNVDAAVQQCQYRPNVYLDISGFSSMKGEGGWVKHLSRLSSKGINHKIIFGTDWPLASMTETYSSQLAKFVSQEGPMHNCQTSDQEKIMWKNMSKLIGETEN